jgi:hypothetical protein
MPDATHDTKVNLDGAVRFNLPRGTVTVGVHAHGDHDGERMLLVPTNALDEAHRVGGDAAGTAVALLIGSACGARAAKSLGGAPGVAAASFDHVASELGLQLSLAGVGAIDLERWGRALVLVVENPATSSDVLLAAICEGALLAATGRELGCIGIGREGSVARVLVASRAACGRAKDLVANGVAWRDVVSRLQSGGAS